MTPLSGQQYQQLMNVLIRLFPTPQRLEIFLTTRLDKNLYVVAGPGELDYQMFNLIRTAESEGWTARLIAAAREARPTDDQLVAFAQAVGQAASSANRQELERTIKDTSSYLDVAQWRTRLGQIETQVGRVEVKLKNGQVAFGTGFLIRPDAVLTNYHVVKPVFDGQADAKAIIVRFDYKILADGVQINGGSPYALANDWVIASSPYSPVDKLTDPAGQLPTPDDLDFAILRLDGAPGDQPVGKPGDPEDY
jgi:hypothetical protein